MFEMKSKGDDFISFGFAKIVELDSNGTGIDDVSKLEKGSFLPMIYPLSIY